MLKAMSEQLLIKFRHAQFIVFDNDGTLLNGLDFSWTAFKKAWETLDKTQKFDIDMPSKSAFASLIGCPWFEFFPKLLPEKYQHLSDELHAEIAKHEISELHAGKGRLFSGIPEVLSTLKKRGFPMLLVSNASTEYFNACIESLNYSAYFQDCYCVGETRKSKGEILKEAIKMHGFMQGVIIGDRKSDIDAGKFNELSTIGVTYGYGTSEELANADLLISDPATLIQIF